MASYSVSKARKFVEGFEGAGIVLGVDVHKNSYHAALRREDGRTLTWVGPADPRSFVEHLLEIGVRVDAVAYEAGPTGSACVVWLRRQDCTALSRRQARSPVLSASERREDAAGSVARGQKRLRSLLVEAAWIWRSRDEIAQELYNRVLSRTGVAQKAITALARRLAIILWRIRVEGRAYRPSTVPTI